MADVDELARRAVGGFLQFAGRARAAALRATIFVAVIAVGVYLLGLAGLKGSTRTGWAVIGAVLVVATVGAPLLAVFRLARIRSHADALITDVKALLVGGGEPRQVVIETVEVQEGAPGSTPVVIGQTTQFTRLRGAASAAGNLRTLPGVLTTLTTFPLLLLVAVVMTLVFVVLGFIFLLALVF